MLPKGGSGGAVEDALELDQDSSQTIPKPWVFPVPKGTLQRIFGTSQVFQGFDNVKPKVTGLTVPLKVREYYHRGQECLEHGDWEMAVLFFSRALHLDSQLVDFYALRAEAYIQLCDFSSAAQNLRRAYSFQPDSKYLERLTFVLYLQGQYLLEHCEFMEALKIFSQAAELQPENPSFRYRCMACLLALRRHHDCLSLVTKEIKGGTVNADIYILRARLYNFFQKPDLCYQDLHSALLWDPKHPQARVLLKTMVEQSQQAHREAGALAVQGKLQLALQRINCAIENNPLDPNLFLFRGTMYRRLQEFDSAVEDFLKALDMMSDSQEDMVQQAQRQLLLAYNDFAVHCYTQGAYQEGVLLLNKALKDEQREKGLYINRGDCFFQLGNLAFAEADYQQALALSPRDEGAHTRMGLLQEKMGFCEHKRRQFQKAESHFSVAIQHNPQKAQYYLHRARNRQLLQDTSGARQDVATVLLLNPNQPKLFMLMTTLFPGMSVEEVLGSQVAHLARLQLQRPVGRLLRERELERQKARDLQLSWSLEEPLLETVEEATPQILWMKRESSKEEDLEEEEEEKENLELSPDRMTSLSDSYPDHTSSGSTLGFRMTSTSEMDTSTSNQDYQSSPATAAPSSSSSPPKEVFKAKHRKTGKKVALKKVLMENEKEGFPITALREIKILQLLKHENVVNLIEICRTKASPYNRCKGSIYLVFDFCEHDLAGLLSNVLVKFTLSEIKKVMQMLLNGLYYIHRNKILHRDMKAANVLITRDGVLKLADFGLARAFSLAKNSQPNRYTNRVVTLWYRPPELLLGERDYGPPIDLWGAGCIMAEMWTRSPIMQGNTEQHQLALISQLCGSITPEVWPNVDKYELFEKLELVKGQKRKVKDRLKAYVRDPYALDLIDKLLVLDPAQRIDSDDALNHDFFWSDPMPSDLKGMLSTHLTSMFEYLAPPRRKGSQITQQSTNQSRNPATTNQTEFERVF
ncbi:Tetratricopeptide repeat protein 16 [Tupaia chinensis]|nr:Tetratricopeptide repeat protein 16 [Tupaia chinensis]